MYTSLCVHPFINCCIFLKLCTCLFYPCMLQAYASTDIMWNKQMLKLNVTRMIYRPNEPKRICTENAPKTICKSCASRNLQFKISKSRGERNKNLILLLIQISFDGMKTREWQKVNSDFCVKKWSNFKYFLVHIDQSYFSKASLTIVIVLRNFLSKKCCGSVFPVVHSRQRREGECCTCSTKKKHHFYQFDSIPIFHDGKSTRDSRRA